MASEVLATLLVLAFGLVLVGAQLTRCPRIERPYLAMSFAAHVFASFVQIWITTRFYEGGDMLNYFTDGTLLARGMDANFDLYARDCLELLLQTEQSKHLPVLLPGTSTGSMVAVAAILAFVFRYSMYAATLTIALAAYFGKVSLYRVFRDSLPEAMRPRLLVATLLIPSVVLWSSGLLKESIAIAAMGALCSGVRRILDGRWAVGSVLVVIGAFPIALVKPYILFPLAAMGGAWLYLDRVHAARGRVGPIIVRPVYLLVAGAVAIGGVLALGSIFPQYAIENLGTEVVRYQRLGAVVGGGSYYRMGNEQARSLAQQVLFAPAALGTALFRPFPFEANNVLAFINALETFAVTLIVIRALLRRSIRRTFELIMSWPILPSALLFTISFGLAVGLATTNFGSLSRYRMPLMPFYGMLALVMASSRANDALGARLARPKRSFVPHAPVTKPRPAARLAAHSRKNA